MEHEKYFSNLDEIERGWKELRSNDFPQILRDKFWGLCMKGQALFWQMAIDDKRNDFSGVSKVPAFERAVMLLEHEGRYQDAIRMCEEANKWEISTGWYSKKIEKLKKLLAKL